MFTVHKDGLLIAKFRTIIQINTWAKRIGIDTNDCVLDFEANLIKHNEWTHADYR